MRHNDIPTSTDAIMALLDRVRDTLDGLDEVTESNLYTNNKMANAEKAAINRKFLLAAHLCDAARLEVMNQYHLFRGDEPPGVIPNPMEVDPA